MKEPNPYAPPGMDASAPGTLPFPFDRKRFVKVYVVCTVAVALWWGAVVGLQTTYALRAFSAEHRAGGIVFVSALCELGAFVAVKAAVLALFFTVHRQSAPSGSRVTTMQLVPFLLALPVAAPVVGCLMVIAAFCTTSLAFDASFNAFWTSIGDFAMPKDVLVGVLKGF